ncbi:MAG TPA: STAS domain-containing protein [Candidatus Anaerobiospirillum pullistercoris]|uniref:STAS domain-containing protein n=1 Tax=Candidatus Anaerobiospirillum pullistercoris TaxID=2838452 RepID=A0A9D2AZX2_9GAMM|nr:STAS domain-containing protein [Candidatus Anaerobiospirillum pullistercoris]
MADLARMTAVEVPVLWEQRSQIFKQSQLDLSQTEAVDSAGIAFLVQWAKSLPQKQLTLLHTPANVQALIKTFRLEPLFVLQAD